MSSSIRLAVVKKLSASSCNICAYRGCEERLSDPAWPSVMADICHIAGEKPTSARHDATMSAEECNEFENLIVLCPNCHVKIDRLEVELHSSEVLLEMKKAAEEACENRTWANDEELTRISLAAMTQLQIPAEPGQLESHVTDVLKILGALTVEHDHGMSGFELQKALVGRGYDELAAAIAMRTLERHGLIEWVTRQNEEHGYEYQVRAITEGGLDLLEATVRLDDLVSKGQAPTHGAPPSAPDYNYDEEPF